MEGLDWAEKGRGSAQANDFTADTIFLSGELKGAKGGGLEGGHGARQERDAHAAEKKLNIPEGKGSGIGRGTSVFAGTKEEEKGEDDHVGHGHHHRIRQVTSVVHELAEDLDRDGLDPSGRWVGALPGPPETGQTEVEVTKGV